MEVGRPTLDSPKGLVVVGRPTFEDSSGARAREGCREVVYGCPDGVDFGFQQGSSPPAPNTKELIDEALMEEASSTAFFFFFSLFFSFGRDGMLVEIVRGVYLGLLRMIMADEKETKVLGVG
ncbi:hypothetical protein AAG906_030690 [Vitis piasezkii]